MHPKKIQSTIKKAIALHQMDKLLKAEQLYKKVLKADPYCVDVLHFYGLLLFNRGQIESATEYILASIGLDPKYVAAYLNLGNIYLKTARLGDARKCYEKALEIDPNHTGVLTNFGILLKCQQMFDASEQQLKAAIKSSPSSGEAYFNLANTYKASGKHEQALEHFKKAVKFSPQHMSAHFELIETSRFLGDTDTANETIANLKNLAVETPRISHMLAAWSGESIPSRASDDYISATFDAYADSFESSLANLGYSGPQLMATALKELYPVAPTNLRVLDAGCGTGLGHAVLKPYASKLMGMDLSQKMLALAREKGSYDLLVCASLEQGIARYNDYFDLVVIIDTLIYFGDLSIVLAATHDALKHDGHLVFTLESSQSPDGFELCQTGRYIHTEKYVKGQLAALSFTLVKFQSCVARQNYGKDVDSFLVVAQKTK